MRYNMNHMELLERISIGDLSVDKAVSIAKGKKKPDGLSRGRLMKIRILDEGKSHSFIIPIALLYSGLSLAKFALERWNGFNDKNAKKVMDALQNIDRRDIKKVVDGIRICKSTGFMEVHGKDSGVSIKII
jgi:hypothetical protein